jgi:hypothetical protein
LPERLTSKSGKRRLMRTHRGQRVDGQRIEQRAEGRRKAVGLPSPPESDGAQAGGRPTDLLCAQCTGFLADAFDQSALAAEKAHAGFNLHDDCQRVPFGFDHRNARRERKLRDRLLHQVVIARSEGRAEGSTHALAQRQVGFLSGLRWGLAFGFPIGGVFFAAVVWIGMHWTGLA